MTELSEALAVWVEMIQMIQKLEISASTHAQCRSVMPISTQRYDDRL